MKPRGALIMAGTRRGLLPFCFGVIAALALPATASAVGVTLEAPASSDTGHFALRWQPERAGEYAYELQRARHRDFSDATTIYRGRDRATTISGLLDGTYFYRVRTEGGEWSEPVGVTVEHHQARKAVFFLALGAAVFLATAGLVITGHRKHRQERSVTREG